MQRRFRIDGQGIEVYARFDLTYGGRARVADAFAEAWVHGHSGVAGGSWWGDDQGHNESQVVEWHGLLEVGETYTMETVVAATAVSSSPEGAGSSAIASASIAFKSAAAPVPEPSSFALVGLGLAVAAVRLFRRPKLSITGKADQKASAGPLG
ncbi:MAG: PEP-CTERM sorting domain-containing protein [Candidatus Eisenbacteria bacterium]|nr:PEP-CTERM sorting domain-containing protein [Candidatus Eisenbacteria bacterium]